MYSPNFLTVSRRNYSLSGIQSLIKVESSKKDIKENLEIVDEYLYDCDDVVIRILHGADSKTSNVCYVYRWFS